MEKYAPKRNLKIQGRKKGGRGRDGGRKEEGRKQGRRGGRKHDHRTCSSSL